MLKILKEKIAGCVLEDKLENSLFWFGDKIDSEKESILLFKTTDELALKLFRRIGQLHPYDVPFIAEIEIKKVNDKYTEWLKDVTQ